MQISRTRNRKTLEDEAIEHSPASFICSCYFRVIPHTRLLVFFSFVARQSFETRAGLRARDFAIVVVGVGVGVGDIFPANIA